MGNIQTKIYEKRRFLTNFDPRETGLYQRAIDETKDNKNLQGMVFEIREPNLERFDEGGEEFCPSPFDKGLYVSYATASLPDTSPFWEVINSLRGSSKSI